MLLLQAAQQAVNAVAQGAVPVADPGSAITFESYVHQAGLAAVSVWVIQTLKQAKWFPLLNANSDALTRLISIATALASALAIQISVTGNASTGWDGSFHIGGAHALWDDAIRVIGSKYGQTLIYNQFYNRPIQVTPVRAPVMDSGGKPKE